MSVRDVIVIMLLVIGTFFFAAGSIGVLRFPDVYTRLHALTKADNLGLGFFVVALSLHSESWSVAAKMGVIWALVLVAGATVSHLVAETARTSGVEPWTKP
jgi:multicomponent Na+:H+ antiporter subunit G